MLPFGLKSQGVVGANSIGENELTSPLLTKVNAKSDVYGEDVTLIANTDYIVSHTLSSSDVIVQFRDSAGEVNNIEMTIDSSSQVTLRSGTGKSGRVVIIG